jgi:Uma2 family endonuclease
MALHEIVLPETKPETEWVRGRPLQKVSPQRTHSRLPLTDEELEIPPLAPDVAVAILSPDDRRADLDDKIDVYLRAGSSLVIVVDPQQRAVELHDRSETMRLDETGAIEHWALPKFSYPVRELFAVLRCS